MLALFRLLSIVLQLPDRDGFQPNPGGRVVDENLPKVVLRKTEQVGISDRSNGCGPPISGVSDIQDADLAEITSRTKCRQDGLSVFRTRLAGALCWRCTFPFQLLLQRNRTIRIISETYTFGSQRLRVYSSCMTLYMRYGIRTLHYVIMQLDWFLII